MATLLIIIIIIIIIPPSFSTSPELLDQGEWG